MKFWYQTKFSWQALILSPFSLIFLLISVINRTLTRSKPYSVPVVVIGNISVGGTGKTPMIIWLAQALKEFGLEPGIVSRGYGSESKIFPLQVTDSILTIDSGDEPKLVQKILNMPVVIDPIRDRAVKYLLKQNKVDVIISDDGLQHYKMHRDIEIVMVDGNRGFGNGWLLPSGPLREFPSRLKTVDFVISKQREFFVNNDHSNSLPQIVADIKVNLPKNYLGFTLHEGDIRLCSAIGNFDSLKKTVQGLGLNIILEDSLRDHARIPQEIINDTRFPIVITEKDAVKLDLSKLEHVYVVSIEFVITENVKATIIAKIQEIIYEKSRHNSG